MFSPPFAAVTLKHILHNNKRHTTWRRPKLHVRILTAAAVEDSRQTIWISTINRFAPYAAERSNNIIYREPAEDGREDELIDVRASDMNVRKFSSKQFAHIVVTDVSRVGVYISRLTIFFMKSMIDVNVLTTTPASGCSD